MIYMIELRQKSADDLFHVPTMTHSYTDTTRDEHVPADTASVHDTERLTPCFTDECDSRAVVSGCSSVAAGDRVRPRTVWRGLDKSVPCTPSSGRKRIWAECIAADADVNSKTL